MYLVSVPNVVAFLSSLVSKVVCACTRFLCLRHR